MLSSIIIQEGVNISIGLLSVLTVVGSTVDACKLMDPARQIIAKIKFFIILFIFVNNDSIKVGVNKNSTKAE